MTASRRGWLWLLAWALVLAPTLGQVHRVVHGPQAAFALAASLSEAGAAQAHEGGHDHSGVAQLFSGHGSDADCRVFDQLGHSDALPVVPALVLPLAAPLFFLDFFQGEALAPWSALFDARGPPSVR